jgi:hypothetical protein
MASTFELEQQVRYAQGLVRQARDNGLIDGRTADEHLNRLGVAPAAQESTVTITVRVTGDLRTLNGAAGQVNREVEQALRTNAQRVGLTVVPGSTQVRAPRG